MKYISNKRKWYNQCTLESYNNYNVNYSSVTPTQINITWLDLYFLEMSTSMNIQ